MRRRLTFILIAGCIALSACRSKPKKPVAALPTVPEVVAEPVANSTRTKGTADSVSKPKPTPLATTPKPPKPPVEPPAVPKPAEPTVANPPTKPLVPKTDEPSAHKPVDPPTVNTPSVGSLPSAAKSPPAHPAKAEASSERPPQSVKPAQPVSPPPAKESLVPAKPGLAPASSMTVPGKVSPTPQPDGRDLGLGVPPAAQTPGAAVAQPLRTPATFPGPPATKPPTPGLSLLGVAGVGTRAPAADTRSLSLPTGSGGSSSVGSTTPLELRLGQGTNQPLRTNDGFKPITVDPLLPADKGASWREQQLAKQAAEQKAREEEQRALKNALYRFLFKNEPGPKPAK